MNSVTLDGEVESALVLNLAGARALFAEKALIKEFRPLCNPCTKCGESIETENSVESHFFNMPRFGGILSICGPQPAKPSTAIPILVKIAA